MTPEASGIPTIPPALRDYLDQTQPQERTDLEQVWTLLEMVRPDDIAAPEETDTAWARLQQAPAAGTQPVRRRAPDRTPAVLRTRPRTIVRAWTSAVALAVIAGLTGWLYWTTPVTHTAPIGSRLTAALPDGSTVELNAGSTLSHRRGYGALPFFQATQRSVTLNGEAFFDVVKTDASFSVETFNARIDVLGTTFNVETWRSNGETRVTLASGRVQVTRAGASEASVVLEEPGQFVRVTTAMQPPTPPQTTRLEHTLAWRTGNFAVYNQPLPAIFERLERHFNVAITVRDEASMTDSLTLFYSEPTNVETIVNDICTTQGLKYQATSRGFEVFGD